MQKNYCYNHSKSYSKSFHFHQCFHYIFQLIDQSFFLHLQFLWSKYSPTSHDLSHSQLHLLGFQINLLSHIFLSTNPLYSHLHLSSFHFCLLLQTLEFDLHLHLQVLCHSKCFVYYSMTPD